MSARDGEIDKITIRRAREADLPVLIDFVVKLALHVAGGAPRTLNEQEGVRLKNYFAAALSDKDKLVIVAEESNTGVVGMGYIYIWRSHGIWEQSAEPEFKSGIIDDVWVEPACRKRGISRAMLRELVSFAERMGVHELILEYSASNREAEATWSNLGFKPTGVRAAASTASVKAALSKPNEQ
jgi:ribosomal protein S18 acetylase RimI-like enzyme